MMSRRALLLGLGALVIEPPTRKLWAMVGPGAGWVQSEQLWVMEMFFMVNGIDPRSVTDPRHPPYTYACLPPRWTQVRA